LSTLLKSGANIVISKAGLKNGTVILSVQSFCKLFVKCPEVFKYQYFSEYYCFDLFLTCCKTHAKLSGPKNVFIDQRSIFNIKI
jgi:hypothetical protein